MQAFSRNEQQMRQVMQSALEGIFPFNPLEELNKQNMAFMENAMKMFAPFIPGADGVLPKADGGDGQLRELQARVAVLQNQLEELGRKK
jgi:polyhydroxyalkanoate synthesis regulator protein